jgi:hypothetical protein
MPAVLCLMGDLILGTFKINLNDLTSTCKVGGYLSTYFFLNFRIKEGRRDQERVEL